ncbi:hypothetical protein [Sanguibacter sp. 25GB23B1]|uniref:hypothetical protein n=1 Tax=unclassified Sanguibacter TaxID=2645534 RepID=UPI0032AFB4A9
MAQELAHEDQVSTRRRGRRRHPVRRAVAVVVGVVVVVLLAAAAWLAVDAVTVRDELTTAADLVEVLQDEVLAGDAESARATLATLQGHASTAHDASHGPHWSLAGALPWAGPNVRAVQEVSEVVLDLSGDVLPGVIEATGLVDPAAIARGDVPLDVAALQTAADAVLTADVAVQAAAQRLAAIDRDELVAAVAAPVDELEAKVQRVAEATAGAAQTARLVPTLLGAGLPVVPDLSQG